jgi:hypothetical protein
MIDGDEKSFINTIYQGAIKLKFNREKQIIGIFSKDGEYVELDNPVPTMNL